jgi:hypothetical protein
MDDLEFRHCADPERGRVHHWFLCDFQPLGKSGHHNRVNCTFPPILSFYYTQHANWLAQAQSVFIFAAAITATTVYGILVGVFESVLKPYNIKASVGKQMLSVVWLAVAFGLASGLFWLFSVCCCSGKSAHKKVSVEKTPYTYERVASPAFPAQQHGHTAYAGGAGHAQTGTAYEPFRASRT